MPDRVVATLWFHVLFFALLGGMELFNGRAACVEGLAGPLTQAQQTPAEMCDSIESNPASQLIFFGLAKYHVLFGVMSLYAILGFSGESLETRNKIRQIMCVLHGINFICDDSWAYFHIHWIKEGHVVLIPQAALAMWNLYCGFSDNPAVTAAGKRK